MSEQLVALTRQDRRLSAIVSRAVVQDEKPTEYCLAEVAVETVRTIGVCERSALAAWHRTEEVRLDDARHVADAITVLLATVPMSAPAGGAPPGDGHAWICQPGAWPALRAALAAQPARVLRFLRESGWSASAGRLVDSRDAYAAYHHGAPDAPALQALPARFRAFVLPLLRGRSWVEVRRALALYWALDLARDERRLACAVRLLARSRAHGLPWLDRIGVAPPDGRDPLLAAVLASGAHDADPAALPPRLFETFGLDDVEGDLDRAGHLFRSLLHGVPASELLEELWIAAAFSPGHHFGQWRVPVSAARSAALPVRHLEHLESLLVHLRDAGALEEYRGFAVRLWRWSVATPARAAILTRPALFAWPAATARCVLDCLVLVRSPGWTDGARWAGFEFVLDRVPARHREKAIGELAAVFQHDRVPRRFIAQAVSFVLRLARPPFSATAGEHGAAALLTRLVGDRWEALERLPDRTLQRLERALFQDHGIRPLEAGLRAMGEMTPRVFWAALAAHPEPLLAAARHVGLLSGPRQRAVLQRFRAHPVAQRRFARRPLDEVCAAIEPVVTRGLPSPIPRRLREHREGRELLSPGSLERHRQAIVRRLTPFRLGLLRLLALEEVRRDVPADLSRDGERHAVQMLGTVEWNRRLLRRVLRVDAASRARFLAEHPANRAWLAGHPRAREAAWAVGLSEEVTIDGGRLSLAFEQEPLEVLRLGTRVGSCLSVGGIHDDAAVSSMTDANKRVVAARDERGGFVARQRVAISDDDRLVCSAVYPLGVAAAVADAFQAYDRRLARALGLPLVPYGDDDYQIVPVLSRADYDDGVWSRLTDTA